MPNQFVRLGDPCANVGCVGRYRHVAPADIARKPGAHPFVLNPGLRIGRCDACGTEVMGLEKEALATASK